MNYVGITKEDVCNGDGLRVVLWLSGCSHYCKNCQNPQTWDKNGGILFDDAALMELRKALEKDYISGITFSGGDPLFESNIREVSQLCFWVKSCFPEKTIWLYTGYTFEEIMGANYLWLNKIINNIDILVDGKYVDELRDVSLKWRGSSNQRVIDVKESITQNKIVLYCD